MNKRIILQIQFRGYQPELYQFPFESDEEHPFVTLSYLQANAYVLSALMSDADEDGWVLDDPWQLRIYEGVLTDLA